MNKASTYMPQIDAMRFIAAFGVISVHWLARFKVPADLSFGPYRVPLLLTLSGFLVCNILIKAKDRSDNKWQAMRTFYIRRLLRILPAYFLFLLMMVLLREGKVLKFFPYYATFTSNYPQFAGTDVYSGNTLHLWNISVLEQFYLAFPLFILFIKKRFELLLAAGLIVAGLGVRTYGAMLNITQINMLPVTNCDFLGTGILLSVMYNRMPALLHQSLKQKAIFIALLSLGAAYAFFYYDKGWPYSLGYNIATGIFCFCLMYQAAVGFTGIPGAVFSFRPIRYLGRLSYGMYIYHMGSPLLLYKVLYLLDLKVKRGYPLYFLNILLLILLCIASWYLVEKPIINLKQRFRFTFKRRRHKQQVTLAEKGESLLAPQPVSM